MPGLRPIPLIPVRPAGFLIFELWQSEQDLAEHFRTPHFADFRAAIAPYARSGRSIPRYFVARSEEFRSSAVIG